MCFLVNTRHFWVHLNWRNLRSNVKVSYSEGMRDLKNGLESQQPQLEHALLIEPSISNRLVNLFLSQPLFPDEIRKMTKPCCI